MAPVKAGPAYQIGILKRFLTGQGPWTKEEIKDGLYWTKLILGLIFGIVLGVLKFKTFLTPLFLYLGIAGYGTTYYVNNVLQVADLFGPNESPMMEGMFQGIPLMVFVWASIYTVLTNL